MGIAFVLFFWGVIGLVLAGVGALTARMLVAYLTRGTIDGRQPLLRQVTLFPFACLIWAAGVFVGQAAVNVVLLHRDIGIGDGFDCPLPNGYALTFIDTTEAGTVYNPKGRPIWSDVGEDTVNDVRQMQLAEGYIIGAVDSKRFEHFGQDGRPVDSWFILDTRTGQRTDFKDYDALYVAAQRICSNRRALL